ncbi:hypothetical protein SAMN04487895_10892 [Paenibacillus sophorae]|uniref:Uncharacterized protein n=1 Tax=Paenibacillus sophorae TaxID=1333845 RepID=A0A1H8Q6H2_9BACL|nr:hypothetical protein [Paenibacillus sophorae]SEO49825.1 hypothetical protein SAMN04487895_10892 [Paenibacillus sophorae]
MSRSQKSEQTTILLRKGKPNLHQSQQERQRGLSGLAAVEN